AGGLGHLGLRAGLGAGRLEGVVRDDHARPGADPRHQRRARDLRATRRCPQRVRRSEERSMRSQPSRFGMAAVSGLALTLASAPSARADLPGTGIVKDVIGGATGWTFSTIAAGIAEWVLGGVSYFVNGAVDFLRTSARPDVEAVWFAGPGSPYAAVRGVALVLLVGFVLLGVLQGLV